MEDKFLQAKCRNLLREYDEVLKFIIAEEERKMKPEKLGTTEFEILKDAIFNSGVREGMRKILAKVNELAQE